MIRRNAALPYDMPDVDIIIIIMIDERATTTIFNDDSNVPLLR